MRLFSLTISLTLLISCSSKEVKNMYLDSFEKWNNLYSNDPKSLDINYFLLDSTYINEVAIPNKNKFVKIIDSLKSKNENQYLVDVYLPHLERFSLISQYNMTADVSYRIRNKSNALELYNQKLFYNKEHEIELIIDIKTNEIVYQK